MVKLAYLRRVVGDGVAECSGRWDGRWNVLELPAVEPDLARRSVRVAVSARARRAAVAHSAREAARHAR